MHRQSFAVLTLTAALVPACDGSTLVDAASESSSLTAAQCDAQTARAAVDACFDAFRTCKSAEGADEAACKATLDACVPEGLPKRGRHGPHDGGCGGGKDHRGPPPGDRPEFRPDGGRPEGGPRGHGRGPGGGGKRGPIGADPAAIDACRTATQTCIDAGTAEETCREQTRTCVHDALAAAFAARCAELTETCTTEQAPGCEALTQRCSEGFTEPAAGTCSTDSAVEP